MSYGHAWRLERLATIQNVLLIGRFLREGGGRQEVWARIDRQGAIALRSPGERTSPNLARIEFVVSSNIPIGKPSGTCRSNGMLAKKIQARPNLPVLVPF